MCNMYLSHPPTLFRGVYFEIENSPGLSITFLNRKFNNTMDQKIKEGKNP
jgi:hypothetical protein